MRVNVMPEILRSDHKTRRPASNAYLYGFLPVLPVEKNRLHSSSNQSNARYSRTRFASYR